MNLIRGQKVKLSDLTKSLDIEVGIHIEYGGPDSIDVTCFGVDQNNRLSDDRYFIFFNQPTSPENALSKIGPVAGDSERFMVNLSKLPNTIKKLVFTVAMDGSGAMNQISRGYLRVLVKNEELVRFPFLGSEFSTEKAIIVGEIYFKELWRLAAVGQGFNGGLSALLKHFGGVDISAASPSLMQSAPSTPPSPKINISKVTMEKRGDKKTVDLRKRGGIQPIHINLNWEQSITRKGFFSASETVNADLDLGCMFVLKDGSMGIIQALGDMFGSKNERPFIYLDKNDRSGQSSDGENLFIMRPDIIDVILIFTFIYKGNANFADVNGRIAIKDELDNVILLRLDNPDKRRTFCAICNIRNIGDKIEITKEEKYFKGHREADKHYRFGFKWTTGNKD